jgi:hypothetical protein
MANRRKLAALLVLAILAVIFFALGGSFVGNQKEDRPLSKVTSNLQLSWLHGNDLYFFTGSFFAKYNLNQNKIERLSDYLDIRSGINSASWSRDSVVFLTSPGDKDRDDVTTAAGQLGEKPYGSHWWKYDFTTRQYQLLEFAGIDKCDAVIQVSSGLLACAASKSGDGSATEVKLFDIQNKNAKTLAYSDDQISNISADGNSVFYIVNGLGGKQTLKAASVSSKENKTLYESGGQLAYYAYPNNEVLVDETQRANPGSEPNVEDETGAPTETSHKLTLFSAAKDVFSKKLKSLPISFYADPAGRVLVSSIDGTIYTVKDSKLQQLSKQSKQQLSQGDFLFKSSGRFYVLGNDYVLSSYPKKEQPAGYRAPESFDITKDNDPSGNSTIDEPGESGTRDAYLFLENVGSSEQELAVGNNLESRGFRPSEFRFKWIVDGVDFNAPIRPKAVIIR